MRIALGVLAVVIVLAVARWLRTLRRGARLTSEVLSGDFSNSPVSEQFDVWFRERPSRQIQKDRFVQLATAMGCPSGRIADHVIRSIVRTWKDPTIPYGSSLGEEIDRLIAFDPPTTLEQKEKQRAALLTIETLKSELRALDAN